MPKEYWEPIRSEGEPSSPLDSGEEDLDSEYGPEVEPGSTGSGSGSGSGDDDGGPGPGDGGGDGTCDADEAGEDGGE
jgi:hypothetical protein